MRYLFGKQRRKNIRNLNKAYWDFALRIEMLEIKVKALEEGSDIKILNPEDLPELTISPPPKRRRGW